MKGGLILLLIALINLGNLHAQSVFKVENRLQQIYVYVPNPISYASFGVDANSTRVKVVGGIVDTVDDVMYWTPQPSSWDSNSYLIFQEKRNETWIPLDTVFSDFRLLDASNFTATPSRVDFHGEPNMLRFEKLKPMVDFECSHLPIDTMVRVVKYDVLFFNENRTVVDSIKDMMNENTDLLKKKVLNEKIKYVQFVNIYLESKFWVSDNVYHMSKVNDGRVYNFR